MNKRFKGATVLLVGMALAGQLAIPAIAAAAKHKVPTDKTSIAAGQKLYLKNCATCHGKTGKGDGPGSDVLEVKPRNYTQGKFLYGSTDDALFKTVWEGSPNKASEMKGWKGRLKESEVLDILAYVKSAFIPKNKLNQPPAKAK